MSETQLERSVLEAKEREELFAIADALGTKPTARAKKADLVSQILRATGVEAEEAPAGEAKPRRGRPKKAPADSAPAGSDGDSSPASAAPADSAEPLPAISADAPDHQNGSAAPAREPAPAQHSGQVGNDSPAHDGGSRHFDAEPGNRRNRRRRGRDRFERAERDLPGQSSESNYSGEPIPVHGYLDMRDEGYGFLRTEGFLSGPGDVYVSISQVRRFALRKGDYLEGAARPAGGNEKYPALL
ncbi:MAG TPA: hypothetical protein VFJ79_08280, partial [Acidimicrobiales bacterium]|nr:hypothetical protein [Acidimicrobiales bacterium]